MWGIIAGDGKLPNLIVEGMIKRGINPVMVTFDPGKVSLVEKSFVLSLTNILAGIKFLKLNRVNKVVIAGVVPKKVIFSVDNVPTEVRKVVDLLKVKDDHSLLSAIVDFIESAGFKVEEYKQWIKEYIAGKGVLSARKPTERERTDIEYGYKIAKAVASYSFGQTVVVKEGVVLSVEAIEGTDEAIRRAGIYGGKGSVVVKVMKDGQDTRYDLPTIGLGTVNSMKEAGASCIAVEAGCTIVVDKDAVIKTMDEVGISLVGV